MKIVTMLILLVMYGIFKYSVYYLADEVNVDRKKALIPGYDLVVYMKYIEIPAWTVLLIFIPLVNVGFVIYLLFKNPEAFITMNPLFMPIVAFKSVELKDPSKNEEIVHKIVKIATIAYSIFLAIIIALMFIIGGFLLVFIYCFLMKRCYKEVVYWDLIKEYLVL